MSEAPLAGRVALVSGGARGLRLPEVAVEH